MERSCWCVDTGYREMRGRKILASKSLTRSPFIHIQCVNILQAISRWLPMKWPAESVRAMSIRQRLELTMTCLNDSSGWVYWSYEDTTWNISDWSCFNKFCAGFVQQHLVVASSAVVLTKPHQQVSLLPLLSSFVLLVSPFPLSTISGKMEPIRSV
jgi:hypothetical protein